MKPSSSPSERAGSDLFAGVFSRGDVAREVSDAAWLRAMLDVEAALSRALARAGLASAKAADAVAVAARTARFDVADIGAKAALTGNPIPRLVELLAAAAPEGAEALHVGATSQDIIDTAMMLLAKRAAPVLLADLAKAADAAASLAERHRASLMAGRTLLQQALPITFGLKAATWLVALDEARARLSEVARTRLCVQLGGAAGTLASLGDRGAGVAFLLADELGLVVPVLPWHTMRLPIVELSAALAGAASVLGKIARDITLLAQSEIAEVREATSPGRGGSSTLPHKRNPVAAVAILGCTRRVPGLLSTLVSASEQEHERAARAWHAEWETFADLLRLVGSAAALCQDLLGGLEVDVARLRANLDASGELPLSEHLTTLLSPALGRLAAHALVEEAAQRASYSGRPLL